jgi:hypothetical protein
MKAFLFGLMVLGLMATAVVGICGGKEEGVAPETTTPLEKFIIQEGPKMISEGNYNQVLDLIEDLPEKTRGNTPIKTLVCFANLKCWVSDRKPFCKTNWWSQREELKSSGNSDATLVLLVLLKDNDKWMRKYAAELLGYIGDKRALKDLGEVAETDNNHRVRSYAKWAYEMIAGEKLKTKSEE